MGESKLSPLQYNVPIANADGTPTPYFIQLLQQLYEEKSATDLIVETGVIPSLPVNTSLTAPDVSATIRVYQAKADQIAIWNDQGSAYMSSDGGSGNFGLNNPTNDGGGAIGWFSPQNRMYMVAWGVVTGFEFKQTPYVSGGVAGYKIFHEGNLSFGAGLTYAGGVLSASGGGAAATPTVRASNIQSSSNNTYTVAWPAGTVAGDVVLIFGEHGFAFNNPANWIVLDNESGANANGITIAKVMTAADIIAGSVNITTAGAFNGVLAAVTITGTTMAGLRAPFSFVRNGAGPAAGGTAALQTYAPLSTDLVIAFAGVRGTSNITFSAGFTSLQAVNAASASGAVGKFTGALSKLGLNETAASSAAGSGYYTSVVILR